LRTNFQQFTAQKLKQLVTGIFSCYLAVYTYRIIAPFVFCLLTRAFVVCVCLYKLTYLLANLLTYILYSFNTFSMFNITFHKTGVWCVTLRILCYKFRHARTIIGSLIMKSVQ